ncbi:UNVERIFIED_CONTAM: putative GTP diphosphokinase RSH1, chloroplastic [Sesamum radiatum]|uniref:GTP diphosphokinase RSH1, chloroplastic n=1 Tax=Sesamum radiatum TaxID=300843 RepID=A0AAW2UT90_SESRA
MPPHKQSSIATETLQVFAPLAKLLGIYQIKIYSVNVTSPMLLSFEHSSFQNLKLLKYLAELENLAFMYTNPQDHAKANKILMMRIEEDQFLDLMTAKIEVRPVCKEPYSVYKAVLKSQSSINEVNQIAQICYHVLGLVHGIWTPIPRAMKDYIATPKPNGYQSLHTTVIPFLYESMFRLEVQVRTEEMDLIAKRGIAAHYSGKGFVNGLVGHVMPNGQSSQGKAVCFNNASVALRIGWLNAIREWQEEFVGNMSSREFVDTVTRDLLGSRVFVFTPRGEVEDFDY